MTKVFLDTNVLLDYLLDRPGADMAECILKFSEEEGYEFFCHLCRCQILLI